MGSHIVDGEFQSDKYPTCPRGKVPLSVKDPDAQDLLWEYAQRRRKIDEEFSEDVETSLKAVGFVPNLTPNQLRQFMLLARETHARLGRVIGAANEFAVDASEELTMAIACVLKFDELLEKAKAGG